MPELFGGLLRIVDRAAIRTAWLVLTVAGLAACNGSAGGPGPVTAAAAPRAQASPGGIWHALGGADESLSLMVAESGELKAFTDGPAFGSGAVVVTDGGRIAGSYDARRIGETGSGAAGAATLRHCEFEGKIVERVSMRIALSCTGGDGTATSEHRTLLFDPHYLSGSSPEAIAGNYTLPFDPLANSLSVGKDGAVFGIYDNGPRCTVNGRARAVDGRFNLYRFDWQLAACAAPHERFEGAELSGLGFLEPAGRPPGTLLLLLTGTVGDRFEFLSLVYEPA